MLHQLVKNNTAGFVHFVLMQEILKSFSKQKMQAMRTNVLEVLKTYPVQLTIRKMKLLL